MPERRGLRAWVRGIRHRWTRARCDAALTGHPWRTPGPVSRVFGLDRGTPIDRVYIEGFLAAHAADITGAVLEIGDATYTTRFGHDVTRCDVVRHRDDAAGGAIAADLMDAPELTGPYQCIILTQTLQHLPEPARAVATLHRLLAPGGVALITVSGLAPLSRFDADRWGDYWRFTSQSLAWVLHTAFPPDRVVVTASGSAWTAMATLQGLAAEELRADELAWRDDDFEVLLTARVVR